MTITRKEVAKILAAMVEWDAEQIELDIAVDWQNGSVDSIDFDIWENREYIDTILSIEKR